MAEADRQADLPDDLLLRVLHFAPAKEAASTVALSRRWRSLLWRSCGAVNLETDVEEYNPPGWGYGGDKRQEFDEALFFSRRDAFVSAAEAALDAADVPITRLTLRFNFKGSYEWSLTKFLHYDRDGSRLPDRGRSRSPVRDCSPEPEGSRSSDRDGSVSSDWSPDREGSQSPDRDGSVSSDWSPDREGSQSPDRDGSERDGSVSSDWSPDREGSQSPDRDGSERDGSVSSDWSPDREGSQSPDRDGSDRDGSWSSDQEGSQSPDRDVSRVWSPNRERSQSPDRDVLSKLLSHRAVRHVEEVRLVANDRGSDTYAYDDDKFSYSSEGILSLSLLSLPSVALRVLELAGCNKFVTLPHSTKLAFPRLRSLRLRHCTVPLDTLQGLVDAAAALTALHLQFLMVPEPQQDMILHCPTATVIVLEGCYWKEKHNPWLDCNEPEEPMEIDAPMLRHFRYKGRLRPFSLNPPPPELARVALHFILRHGRHGKKVWCHDNMYARYAERDLEVFWQFLQCFITAKDLKLRVNALEDIAVLSKAMRLKLLPTFRSLERLELQGLHRPQGVTAAVAIANLLRCCPVLRDLRINLTLACDELAYRPCEHKILRRKFLSDRDMSIHLVNSRRNSPNAYYGDTRCGEASEIPALSRRSFDCLQSSMKKVGLQFRLQNESSLGVKLIKFFAENSMVLEEMCIDAGNEKLGEHMTRKVERWICNSSIKRKPGASSFVVVPIIRGESTNYIVS